MDDWDDAKFRDHIASTLPQFWGSDADKSVIDWLTSRARYQKGNFDDPASFAAVKATIDSIESTSKTGGNRLFYLAVAPSFIATVTSLLAQADPAPRGRRLLASAHHRKAVRARSPVGGRTERRPAEKACAKSRSTVLTTSPAKTRYKDLAVFRFSNTIIEPLWNRSMIDCVQITAAEMVGVEKRAGYYEKSGALRDMVPNHMAEMLSLVAMEPPVSFSAEYMRDKQVELLASVRTLKPEDVAKHAVRGQYGAGTINGQPVAAYNTEPGVDPHSNTETYVAMRVDIDNWRWSGVPFYLRTGKRLSCAETEIVVTFRQPPARLFPNSGQSDKTPNRLIFNLQPKQSIRLSFGAKAPGLKTLVDQNAMEFDFPSGPFGSHAKGYERLLHDVMVGDSTLFQRAEFVERGWKMVQPLLDAWSTPPTEPFPKLRCRFKRPTSGGRPPRSLRTRMAFARKGLALTKQGLRTSACAAFSPLRMQRERCTPVLLVAFLRRLRAHRIGLAERDNLHPLLVHPGLDQRVPRSLRPLLAEHQVVFHRSPLVRKAFYPNLHVRMLVQEVGRMQCGLQGVRTKHSTVVLEVSVRHIDVELLILPYFRFARRSKPALVPVQPRRWNHPHQTASRNRRTCCSHPSRPRVHAGCSAPPANPSCTASPHARRLRSSRPVASRCTSPPGGRAPSWYCRAPESGRPQPHGSHPGCT